MDSLGDNKVVAAMKFKAGNGEVWTGWKAFKAWSAVALLWVVGGSLLIGFLVGLFFLKSYRWGQCP